MFLHHTVIVPVNGITKAGRGRARLRDDDLRGCPRGVRRGRLPTTAETCARQWDEWDIGVELTIVPSPYRSILRPLVEYVNGLARARRGELVTVVVPEIVPRTLVGASAAQQDGAVHPHGVSLPAERRRDGGAVSGRACRAATRCDESRRVARRGARPRVVRRRGSSASDEQRERERNRRGDETCGRRVDPRVVRDDRKAHDEQRHDSCRHRDERLGRLARRTYSPPITGTSSVTPRSA